VGGVFDGKIGEWVAKAATAAGIPECDEVRFGWVDTQARAGHPVGNHMEVGSNLVGQLDMITCDSNDGPIINVELGPAVHPALGQAQEGGSV
jgi:hypothetical protein